MAGGGSTGGPHSAWPGYMCCRACTAESTAPRSTVHLKPIPEGPCAKARLRHGAHRRRPPGALVPCLRRQGNPLPPRGSLPLQPPHSLCRHLPPWHRRLPSNCTRISLAYGARTWQARLPEEVRRMAGAALGHHQRPRSVLRGTGCHSHARPSPRSGRQTAPAQSRAQRTAHPRPHFNATDMPFDHSELQTLHLA
jgi:hypothetical protein